MVKQGQQLLVDIVRLTGLRYARAEEILRHAQKGSENAQLSRTS